MQIREIVGQVGISDDVWQEAIKRHDVAREEFDGVCYYRITKKSGPLAKGAIVTPEGVIFDFPRIARILHLEKGLHHAYAQPFYIEEKVDGYNVRIASIEGRILVFSRGAYVCPFSTDRVVDFFDVKEVFKKNPGLIICGEFAGPDNPYNIEHPPYVKEDVRFFAFDLMQMNKPGNIPIEKRYKLFDNYSIPTVRRFGRFSTSDMAALKRIIGELDESGCEGMLMKPLNPAEATLKYVTLHSCLRDIRVTAHLMPEMMSEFFTHRTIRAAMYAHEQMHGLKPEVFAKLGEALLGPVYDSVAKAARAEVIDERFTLRFLDEKNIQRMVDHLYRCKVKFEVLSKNKVGVYWHVEIARKCYATYEMLQKYLEGYPHVD